MKKKYVISLVLILSLLLESLTSYAASASFADVKESNWAYSYIKQLVEEKGINGYLDNTFRPNNTITAAEFVKITIALINGEKEPTGKHWASGYMLDASLLGIVPDGMFEESDWDKPIQRQKMGVIMERTAQLMLDEDVVTDTAKIEAAKKGIRDYSSICDYCKDYVVQALLRGLITGYTDGTFGPEKTATRAEASTMIIRLIEPAYRTYIAEAEPDDTVVASGTNLSDYIKSENMLKVLDDIVNKYVVLENGDKFSLEYLYSSSTHFFVQYKIYGNVYTLDKEGYFIDISNVLNKPNTLVSQPFDGSLSGTAYFVFVDVAEDIAYIVPNNLTE